MVCACIKTCWPYLCLLVAMLVHTKDPTSKYRCPCSYIASYISRAILTEQIFVANESTIALSHIYEMSHIYLKRQISVISHVSEMSLI